MKKYLYIALAALGMMGCSDDTFEQDGEGVGYLRLELGKVDVELSSLTKAEADPLPNDLVPAKADFMVDVKMGGKSVDGFPKPYSHIIETGGIELKAGTYTVIAYHGEDKPIQAEPYFEGSSTVQINPGQATSAKIEAALANAMLLPAVSESLQKHYSDWTLTAKVGDASQTLADNENLDGYLFVQAERAVNAVFEGTNQLGNKTTHEWTVISSAAKQTRYVIQCDPDLSISFGLKAVAEHTTDNSGYLNGTKVSLSFENLSNVPVSLISDWKATLVNASGEEVRSYSTNDFTNTEMEVVNDWTYLPQGNYTLKYSYTIDGETMNEDATVPQTITMPQPTFDVEVSAQTSYSVYTTEGAAAANEKDGASIFDVSATTTISPDILNNEKYANLLMVTYTLDTGESTTEESPKFENLQWGKRKLTAIAVFDGSSATSAQDCDVTGLPYSISFNKNTNPTDWTLSNNGKCGDRLTLKRGDAYALSPKFYIPANIEVDVLLNAYAYGGTVFGSYKPTVSIHPSEIGQNSTVLMTLSGTNLLPNVGATFHDINTAFTLTDTVGKICIYTQGEGSRFSVGAGDMGVVCDHFSVQYKD